MEYNYEAFPNMTIEKPLSKVHIRIQQRNKKKSITTIQGLDEDLDQKRICRSMRKIFNCNGAIIVDKDHGEIIQLQGDQRSNIQQWLIVQEVMTPSEAKERLIIHGF